MTKYKKIHPNDTYEEVLDVKTGELTNHGRKYFLRENGSWNIEEFNGEPSLTQTQFQKQSDINEIMKNYPNLHLTGTGQYTGIFADVSNLPDYQNALHIVEDATSAFMALDANLRKKFENNPQRLIDFLGDEKNREEAISLGLIPKPETQPNYQEQILNELKQQNPKTKKINELKQKIIQVETDPDIES